jgi:hypothetical protein
MNNVSCQIQILFWGQKSENIFCNRTVLIVVDYRGGSSETVHPGNPTRPSDKDRWAPGTRCVSLGPVRAGALSFKLPSANGPPRWRIEAAFCRLKDFRRIATRYDKLAANFASAHRSRYRHRLLVLGSGILDVEASHLAVSKAEDVSNRLVLQPVRLPLKRLAFEIVDGLPNLYDDCVVSSLVEAHRFDVRTDHGPLAGPVLAHGLATVNVAAIHAVGPSDIIGKHGQHAIDIPRVEAVVDAFQGFDITFHRALSSLVPVLRQGTEAIYIWCRTQ